MLQVRSRNRNNNSSSNSRQSSIGNPRVRTRGILFPVVDRIETDPSVDPPPGTCYNCWQPGHKYDKCPEPRVEMCPNCARRDVDLLTCPRCSRIYREYTEGKRRFRLDNYYWYCNNKRKSEEKNDDNNKVKRSSGKEMLNVRVSDVPAIPKVTERVNRARSLVSSSIDGTIGSDFDNDFVMKTIRGDNLMRMSTNFRDVDDPVTADDDLISLSCSTLGGTNVTECPSSAGATCSATPSDLLGRVTNLLELMAPLSASTQSLVMKGIFSNEEEEYVDDGMEFTVASNIGESGM